MTIKSRKMMKKILQILILALTVSGCTLSVVNVKTELIEAPKLDVSLEQDVNFQYFKNGRILLFDPAETLIFDTLVGGGLMPSSFPVVHGVMPGNYTMVAFYNVEKSELKNIEVGKSKLVQVAYGMLPIGGDKLFLQRGKYELKRGNPVVSHDPSMPLFYNVTITLTDVDKLTQKPLNPWVEMLGLPTEFDGTAKHINGTVANVKMPDLVELEGGKLQTKAVMPKFGDDNGVRIKIKELIKEDIETVVINPSKYIDVTSTAPQDLNIEMRYKAYTFELIVNDWIVGEYRFAEFGG